MSERLAEKVALELVIYFSNQSEHGLNLDDLEPTRAKAREIVEIIAAQVEAETIERCVAELSSGDSYRIMYVMPRKYAKDGGE